jgi:hypothetical protein
VHDSRNAIHIAVIISVPQFHIMDPQLSSTVDRYAAAVIFCGQLLQLLWEAVQLCPDRHPAVGSVALWGTVQKYPACSAGTRFADVECGS